MIEVKEHFGKQSHDVQCLVCLKVFRDEMAVIQHFQTHNSLQHVPASVPGLSQKAPSANLMIYGGPAATSLLPIENAQMNSQEVFVTPFWKKMHSGGEAGPIESPFLVPLIASNGTGASGKLSNFFCSLLRSLK